MKKPIVFLVSLWILAAPLMAQMYDGNPCESFVNKQMYPVLDKENSGKFVTISLADAIYGGFADFSTSFLKPSGTAPTLPKGEPNSDEETDMWEEMTIANHKWTCMYSAYSLTDGDPKTAWVEGVSGYGGGEAVLTLGLDLSKKVEIWAGYGKSDKLHRYNSRPKTIRVHVLQVEKCGATQGGWGLSGLKIIGTRQMELEDHNGWQSLYLPTVFWEELPTDCPYFLGIEIVDAFPGEKWDDTCISEVRNRD